MAKMDLPTHLLNILHLERSYLIQRDFQAELGFGWAMVSWFASGMMFGRATLLRDACHNLYQFTRFSWPQSDRLHSIWRRKKDFSLYSTTHPRAFGFRILFFSFFLTSFKGEWRPSLEVLARSKGYNTYETLASLTFWGITFATTLVA